MYQKLKSWLKSKALYFILILCLVVIYKLFVANYTLQSPVVSKSVESYTNVWNERAACLLQADSLQKARAESNSDIFTPYESAVK